MWVNNKNGGFFMVKNKKLFDEHEIIGNSDYEIKIKHTKKWNIILCLLLITLATAFAIYAIEIMMQRKQEKLQIDEIISSIQSEIFIKQCQLDKMYCCGYKDENSCNKWIEKGCTEPDGSPNINCATILEKTTKSE